MDVLFIGPWSTACSQFAWRTTSLCVGGRAARRSYLPGLRVTAAEVDRQARRSCLVWWCKLTTGQVRSASKCVRRSHCTARHTPTQTRHRMHLSGGRADSIHTSHHYTRQWDTTKQFCLCRVWRGGVN